MIQYTHKAVTDINYEHVEQNDVICLWDQETNEPIEQFWVSHVSHEGEVFGQYLGESINKPEVKYAHKTFRKLFTVIGEYAI